MYHHCWPSMTMSKLTDICPDFQKWPDRWMGIEPDLDYGRQVLEAFRPFAESLLESGLTQKTVKRHLTNLWFLRGEIIRDVSLFNEYSIPAHDKLVQSKGTEGGPVCRHLDSEPEIKAYDGTCRKFYNYLKEKSK